MGPRKTTTVKRIFLFFFLYLPLQYALIGVIGELYSEPWPAFALPGFTNIYATQNNNVEVRAPKVFAHLANAPDQQVEEIEASELFQKLPRSQLRGFLRSNFAEQKEYSTEAKEWLANQLNELYPGREFTKLQIKWIPTVYYQQDDTINAVTKESVQTVTIHLDAE